MADVEALTELMASLSLKTTTTQPSSCVEQQLSLVDLMASLSLNEIAYEPLMAPKKLTSSSSQTENLSNSIVLTLVAMTNHKSNVVPVNLQSIYQTSSYLTHQSQRCVMITSNRLSTTHPASFESQTPYSLYPNSPIISKTELYFPFQLFAVFLHSFSPHFKPLSLYSCWSHSEILSLCFLLLFTIKFLVSMADKGKRKRIPEEEEGNDIINLEQAFVAKLALPPTNVISFERDTIRSINEGVHISCKKMISFYTNQLAAGEDGSNFVTIVLDYRNSSSLELSVEDRAVVGHQRSDSSTTSSSSDKKTFLLPQFIVAVSEDKKLIESGSSCERKAEVADCGPSTYQSNMTPIYSQINKVHFLYMTTSKNEELVALAHWPRFRQVQCFQRRRGRGRSHPMRLRVSTEHGD